MPCERDVRGKEENIRPLNSSSDLEVIKEEKWKMKKEKRKRKKVKVKGRE